MITERVLNKDIIDKKVKIGVAFNETRPYNGMSMIATKYYEGIIATIGTIGKESFIVFEDNSMINAKYIQTIEIIG